MIWPGGPAVRSHHTGTCFAGRILVGIVRVRQRFHTRRGDRFRLIVVEIRTRRGQSVAQVPRGFPTAVVVHEDGRGEDVAQEVLLNSGESNGSDPDQFRARIVEMVSSQGGQGRDRMSVGRVVLGTHQIATECGIHLRDEVRMLGKTLVQLDELFGVLHPEFNPQQQLRSELGKIVESVSRTESVFTDLIRMFTESSELARERPARLNHFTRLLSQNKIRVKLDAVDENAFLKSLHKIANRITTGLILAALVIGASLMMRLETSFTIFGYPAIARAFFLIAAVCGLRLIYRATFEDSRELP